MKESYRDGFAEVDMILNYVDEESSEKIPESFKKFIKENKSNYIAQINPDKALNEQNLLYETKVILSVMYRDFWSTEEEREKLITEEKEELQKLEKEKLKLEKQKYVYNDLFKDRKIKRNISANTNTNVNTNIRINNEKTTNIAVQESLFKSILKKIKSFFSLGNS